MGVIKQPFKKELSGYLRHPAIVSDLSNKKLMFTIFDISKLEKLHRLESRLHDVQLAC